VLLHPFIEVYGICHAFRKWGRRNPATIEANWEAGLAEVRRSFWRRHWWAKWVAGGLLLTLAGAAVVVDVALHRAEPFLRARIVDGLADRFHARVELDSFHVSLANGLWAEGKGLRIWPPARVEGVAVAAGQEGAKEAEPLIRLAEFRFHAPLEYRPGKPIHISVVELKGLNVHLPPKSHFEHGAARTRADPNPPANPGVRRGWCVLRWRRWSAPAPSWCWKPASRASCRWNLRLRT